MGLGSEYTIVEQISRGQKGAEEEEEEEEEVEVEQNTAEFRQRDYYFS